MATKTLGIKFEIAGVKEAQAGLKNLRNNLNASLKQNKEAINNAVKLNNIIPVRKSQIKQASQVDRSPVTDSRDVNKNVVSLDSRTISELGKLINTGDRVEMPASDPISQIRKKGMIKGSFSSMGNNLRSVYKGFLESIGGGLGTDFGEGLKKALEDDLDFSFRRRGEVTGKTAAYAISEGGRGLRKEFGHLLTLMRKTKVKDTTPSQAAENANEVRKSFTRLLSLLPTSIATGYRRASIQLEGLPRVDKLKNRDENKATQFKDTTKSVVYSFGGFAGKEGKAGFENAEMLKELADDLTEIVGMGTQFTDLTVNAKKTTQWVIEALGTVAGINLKGFNPDAIKGSAKIINDLDANPDIKAKILGHSAGGFPAEEIVQILNLLGYGDRISGISVGTPNMKGRLDSPNFDRVMGEGDKIMRGFEKGIDPIGLFADDAEILEDVDGHGLQDYLQNERFLELVFGKRIKTLVKRYQEYLKNIAKEAKKSASNKINDVIPNYQDLTLDQKKNTAGVFNKSLKLISKRYRQAIKDNDLNLARELGENLLEQIQYLKQIYGDILEDGGNDRSISGKLGNLTKIETEIISGQPNLEAQGFDSKGLASHFGEQLTSKGEDVIDGFIDGIRAELKRVKEAGADIGENLQDGTDDNLGIASPSKRYIKKGKEVVQGFVNGIKGNLKNAAEAGKKLGDASVDGLEKRLPVLDRLRATAKAKIKYDANRYRDRGKQVTQGYVDGVKSKINDAVSVGENLGDAASKGVERGISKGVESVKSEISEFFKAIGDRFPILKKFKGLLAGIAALFVAKIGLDFIISGIKKIGGESLDAAMAMESLNLSILYASRNALKGGAALEFISQSAKQLSIDLISAKNQYSKLLAAARNTSLEGDQINRIFNAFAETAANRGLGAGQQQQVFKALEQIINKRYLGREEVVQQLGDVFSGFEVLLSESLGVNSSQLGKMMENRELGLDVLPKIAAALEAQTAAMGNIDTAQKAQTRFNNALLESKVAIGELLQPLQKFVLKLSTKVVEDFRGKLFLLFKLISLTGVVTLVAMFNQVNLIELAFNSAKIATDGLKASINQLSAAKVRSLAGSLWKLVKVYGLVVAAYKIWIHVLGDGARNQYQEQIDGVERLTASIDRYRESVAKANKQKLEGDRANPKELQEGWKLPDNNLGLALGAILGGDRLNLDNLVRNKINWLGEQYGRYQQFVFDKTGQTNVKPFKVGTLTEQERRQDDAVSATGDLIFETDKLLSESQAAFIAAEKIANLDAEIAKIQNEREVLVLGDKKALESSRQAERNITEKRDEETKILADYQQSLQLAIAEIKKNLEALEAGKQRGEFVDLEVYETKKADLLDRQEASVKKLDKINAIISNLTKTLSVYEKKLKTSAIGLTDFTDRRQLEGEQERTEIITEGIELQKGDRTIELEINAASRRELQDIIAETEKVLAENIKRLESPALNSGYLQAKNLAQAKGVNLDPAGIEELLTLDLSQQVKDALLYLQKIREQEKTLSGYQEQLAQNLQSNRNAFRDFQRSIDDYFFNINQQIKEAQIEVLRIVDQIIFTNVRNKIQSALSPHADSFVNQLISSTQSLLDQAASYSEKLLGQRSARVQLAGQQRSLQYELNDFARNVRGAGDALVEFKNKISGAASTSPKVSNSNESENVSTKRTSSNNNYFPIANMTASTAKITSGYGWRNIFGRKDFHEGIDIAVKGGTEVRATDSGIVRHIKPLADQTQVGIETAKGVMEWFIHLGQNLKVQKGDRVNTGDVIGYVAKTTQRARNAKVSTGDHLDYRVQVDGKWVNPLEFLQSKENSLPVISSNEKLPLPPNVTKKAERDTEFLNSKQQQLVELKEELLKLEGEALKQGIEQNIKADRLKIDNQIVDTQFALSKLLDVGKDMAGQYDYQTATNQSAKNIRDVNNAFSDRGLEISRQIVKYVEEINAINDLITLAPEQIKLLRKSGKNNEADLLTEKISQARLLLEPYQDHLKGLVEEYQANTTAAETALNFVTEQNKLKEQQEHLNKRSLLLNQQATIAEQRGTLEQQRKVKIAQEEVRLQREISDIKLNNAPGKQRDSLIKNERSLSNINLDNIDYQAQLDELAIEKQLLDRRTEIDNKKASLFSRFGGVNFGAEKIKRDNAIAQENLRFERELIELRKQYKDQPELLEQLARNAEELNRVNLSSIKNEFKTLGSTVQDAFNSSAQGFFTNIQNNLFDSSGARQKAELEERLRYAEQVVQLEAQYSDYSQAGELAHLKNRARELNEQKLDDINNEFNIFKRGVDLAKQALLEFTKQLAAAIAQAAAAKIIGAIIGGVAGGFSGGVSSVGNDFGSGAGYSAFVADEGITVGEGRGQSQGIPLRITAEGAKDNRLSARRLNNRTTNYLRRIFPGVAKAWNKEGKDAQLGVFHKNEELISDKTGEAPAYRGLKRLFGVNPAQKIIQHFDVGGTVGFDAEANILSGFRSSRPSFDFSTLDDAAGGRQTPIKNITLQTTVITPDADSFRLNEDQQNQDLMIRLQRGI